MASDEDPTGRADRPDPDRAAILSRRQHFIALALSGLALHGCVCRDPAPQVCLSPPMDTASPKPCLSKIAPEVCLSVALPPSGNPPADASNKNAPFIPRDEGGTAIPEVEPEPIPMPCLSMDAPE